jgi:hypothetical protein
MEPKQQQEESKSSAAKWSQEIGSSSSWGRERSRARAGGGRQGAVAKAVTAAGVVCAFEKRWDLHRRL